MQRSQFLSKQIILTGLPRSGTTLVCHLLNKLPTCVALHEPIIPLDFAQYDRGSLVSIILEYFSIQRRQILQTGTAVSNSLDGQVPDNHMAGLDPNTGKRIRTLDGRSVDIDKHLPSDFCLAIKQPAFFTAILQDLTTTTDLSCFAVVRNPLSVLLSWNSVEMPVSRGHVPAAEAFSIDLRLSLDAIRDTYERQVFLLDWFFQQYLNYLPREHILFYEETVKTSGRSLAVINNEATSLSEALKSKNNNSLYNKELKTLLVEKLLNKHKGAFWDFYTEEEVLALANSN